MPMPATPTTSAQKPPARSMKRPVKGDSSSGGRPKVKNVSPMAARSAPSEVRYRLQMTS